VGSFESDQVKSDTAKMGEGRERGREGERVKR